MSSFPGVLYTDPTGKFSVAFMAFASFSVGFAVGFQGTYFTARLITQRDRDHDVYLDTTNFTTGRFNAITAKAKMLEKLKTDFRGYNLNFIDHPAPSIRHRQIQFSSAASAENDAYNTVRGITHFYRAVVHSETIANELNSEVSFSGIDYQDCLRQNNTGGSGYSTLTDEQVGIAIGNIASHELLHAFGWTQHDQTPNFIMEEGGGHCLWYPKQWSPKSIEFLSKRFSR